MCLRGCEADRGKWSLEMRPGDRSKQLIQGNRQMKPTMVMEIEADGKSQKIRERIEFPGRYRIGIPSQCEKDLKVQGDLS